MLTERNRSIVLISFLEILFTLARVYAGGGGGGSGGLPVTPSQIHNIHNDMQNYLILNYKNTYYVFTTSDLS